MAGGPSYIRGGRGVDVESRTIGRALFAGGVVVLVILVAVLGVEAVRQNSRAERLHRDGVAVQVTVTSCLGVASGTGTTESGYSCRGTFTLDGRSYNEVIGGSVALHHAGDTIRAVTVSGDPKLLTVARSAMVEPSKWHAFIPPAIPLILLIGLSAVPLIARRNRAKPNRNPASSSTG
jgi:hypothetical protein